MPSLAQLLFCVLPLMASVLSPMLHYSNVLWGLSVLARCSPYA